MLLSRHTRRREFIASLLLASTIRRTRALQPGKIYRIAVVSAATSVADMHENTAASHFGAFFRELRRLGHVEGQNLIVERHSGEGRTERFAELVARVIQQQPDVIFVASNNSIVLQFKEATAVIPIIATMGDPVVSGLVASLARPGANITGVSADAGIEVWGKRLELLKEVVPMASKVALLASREYWLGPTGTMTREAATKMGMTFIGAPLEGTIRDAEYRRVFDAMAHERADALVVGAESETFANRELIVALTKKHRMPAIYPFRALVEMGGLMAYAHDIDDNFRCRIRRPRS